MSLLKGRSHTDRLADEAAHRRQKGWSVSGVMDIGALDSRFVGPLSDLS